jgi:two-component system phosphate regulon sensor histidine kinase PhoR
MPVGRPKTYAVLRFAQPLCDIGLFETGIRKDKARSREPGGTGLGLSIVKHFVLAHKGDVDVRSRINQGSVFSVLFPVTEHDHTENGA